MKPRSLLAAALVVSGLGDALGGLWAAFDWRGHRASSRGDSGLGPRNSARRGIGLADDALHQLWANLGTALLALGAAQLLAARWVAQDKPAGYDLARVIGWALLVAGGMMAVTVPQLSSLLTESARGLAIVALSVWARTAHERGR
jgi:hypothetical protein